MTIDHDMQEAECEREKGRGFPHRLRLMWNGVIVLDAQCTSVMASDTTKSFFENNMLESRKHLEWQEVAFNRLLDKLLDGERFAAEYYGHDIQKKLQVLIEPNEKFFEKPKAYATPQSPPALPQGYWLRSPEDTLSMGGLWSVWKAEKLIKTFLTKEAAVKWLEENKKED